MVGARELLKRFAREEDGLELLEYAILALVLAVALTAAYRTFGDQIGGVVGRVSDAVGSLQ